MANKSTKKKPGTIKTFQITPDIEAKIRKLEWANPGFNFSGWVRGLIEKATKNL